MDHKRNIWKNKPQMNDFSARKGKTKENPEKKITFTKRKKKNNFVLFGLVVQLDKWPGKSLLKQQKTLT